LYSLKRRFQQNQNDCVFTVLSLLPTLGDQILHEMNIEEGWAKLQETRRLEKIELQLRKEREATALFREEQEALDQLKDDTEAEKNTTNEPVVIVESEEKTEEEAKQETKEGEEEKKEDNPPTEEDNSILKSPELKKTGELDSSVGSLASSFVVEEDTPLPPGILSKKEKNALWDEIKTMSKLLQWLIDFGLNLFI
jgi:peroxin-3